MKEIHPIVRELSKLRESSREAIADSNVEMDDELKEYLHIEREVEKQLIQIIKEESEKKESSSLILVCGNVGDGKSHILSSLQKHKDVGHLLKDFKIHNDATESFSPSKGCIETLDEILAPFRDENIETVCVKQIVAINLGTLSNFISEKGDSYQELKGYIEVNRIIEANEVQQKEVKHEKFHHVNFTDYHLYALTEEGGESIVVKELLDRVCAEHKKNPIYRAYQEIKGRKEFEKCPIKNNYEFLMQERNRKQIGNLILQLQVSKKQIISIRHLLNFIHDLVVSPDFANLNLEEHLKRISKLRDEEQLKFHLPVYLFEYPSLSKIFKGLNKIDPCKKRNEEIDELIVKIHVTKEPLTKLFGSNSFYDQINLNQIGEKSAGKKLLSKTFIRSQFFKNPDVKLFDGCITDYLQALYYYNINDERKLKPTHQYLKSAIVRWNGNNNMDQKIMIHMDAAQNQYRLFKDHEINEKLNLKEKIRVNGPIDKFATELKLEFETAQRSYKILIDFPLYVLLRKITKGYRPNKLDRNNYIQFTKVVENLTLDGAEKASIYIDEVNIDEDLDFVLKRDAWGEFEFQKRN
jgi:DNA phosphorothioation-dependent restriction protein DptF